MAGPRLPSPISVLQKTTGVSKDDLFILPHRGILFEITQEELQSFPSDTKLIIEICADDAVNDHRMAADMFTNINIDDAEKDFLVVQSDTINGYIYYAGHDVPTNYNAFDALDYYAYYRLIDALCDYTFNGNPAGKEVALGNGSTDQVMMPPV